MLVIVVKFFFFKNSIGSLFFLLKILRFSSLFNNLALYCNGYSFLVSGLQTPRSEINRRAGNDGKLVRLFVFMLNARAKPWQIFERWRPPADEFNVKVNLDMSKVYSVLIKMKFQREKDVKERSAQSTKSCPRRRRGKRELCKICRHSRSANDFPHIYENS